MIVRKWLYVNAFAFCHNYIFPSSVCFSSIIHISEYTVCFSSTIHISEYTVLLLLQSLFEGWHFFIWKNVSFLADKGWKNMFKEKGWHFI